MNCKNKKKSKQEGKINILILVIFVIIIVGIVVLIFKEREPRPVQFCDRVIAEAQLRKIINYNGIFTFEETIEEIIENEIVKICDFQSEDLALTGAIALFPLEATYITYEKLKQEFTDIVGRKMPLVTAELIRNIDDIGKQAFIVSINDTFHQLFFENEKNQIVSLIIEGLNYDLFMETVRQVEINVKRNF